MDCRRHGLGSAPWPGLIKDEDIQLVRERARIDEVIEPVRHLRKSAGGGSRKGLCPFHDEKSPSFNVRPAQGYYHCFGCGVGGDAIKFLLEIEGITFVESVERLAYKYGIQLRYEEGGSPGPRRDPGQRQRLLEAHRLAGEFYASVLGSVAEARAGPRASSRTAVSTSPLPRRFGVGFAPRRVRRWSAHLKGKGFTDEELLVGGLASRGQRGLYDRFRGRLLWPIREMTGEIDRVRRSADVRRRPRRGQVPQHVRDADLQEEPGALRPRPRPPAHLVVQPGGGRRGLHRRHGLPPGRRARPRSPPAARPSARTTPACCAASCSTTTPSTARSSSRSTATRPASGRP